MTQPTKLTEAVAAVMREVHRLKKDETNKHGGYKYVSVDDVKDHVRPLLGKHGLEIAISETEFSVDALQTKSGTTLSAKITYEVNVRHVSGEEGKPERITVMLPYTGAQTTGAARSYAIKEWLKGRFLVSTGEKDMIEGGADADAYSQTEYSKPIAESVNITIGAEQFRILRDLISKSGTEEPKLLAYVKAESLEEMTVAQFHTARAALLKKINTAKAEAA